MPPAFFTLEGELVAAREDVGRHNAVDKVIGMLFREGRLPLSDSILFVSGRASFEIVQKARGRRHPDRRRRLGALDASPSIWPAPRA